MDTKEYTVKGSAKYLVEQKLGKQITIICSKSKDKILGGKISPKADANLSRNKIANKVQKISRVSSKRNVSGNTNRMGVKLDDSSGDNDNKAGPSKLPKSPLKKNVTGFAVEKPKPSQIPRRKLLLKERAKDPVLMKEGLLQGDSKNPRKVQRVQLLINQDFHPEKRQPRAALTAPRPIPTLGHIYARNNVIDTDRLGDWFAELNTPANSLASNFFNTSRRTDVQAAVENNIAHKFRTTTVSNVEFDGYPQTGYRTSDHRSLSVADCLSTDVEYPTRDNDSVFIISTPSLARVDADVESKHSKTSLPIKVDVPEKEQQSKISSRTPTVTEISELIEMPQPTVVVAQMDLAKNTKTITVIDQNKCDQSPSHATGTPVSDIQAQAAVPSYVECPSEILQKTTNFEDMTVTCDSVNTDGSIAYTDHENRDGVSSMMSRDTLASQYTEHEAFNEDRSMEWYHRSGSSERVGKKEDEYSVADSLFRFEDDFMDASLINGSGADNLVQQYLWKRHHGNSVRHCKKGQIYKRFPSNRYKNFTDLCSVSSVKVPKTLFGFRDRMSIRLCRRHLSKVWKKTTEKWATWSAKTPSTRFKKLRVMHYLQHSLIWDDANVQTNIYHYKDTGTTTLKVPMASAVISPFLLLGSPTILNKGTGSTTSSFKARHANLGPSMFPFFHKSKDNGLSSQRVTAPKSYTMKHFDNLKAVGMMTSMQRDNHVYTQTSDSLCSKEKSDIKFDKQRMQEIESENIIEICEVITDSKHTDMADMTSLLTENGTSTSLHLDPMRRNNFEAQSAHTQMCIVCNNAETDAKFAPFEDCGKASVLTSISDRQWKMTSSFGTNTGLTSLHYKDMMTSTEKLQTTLPSNHIQTQVTPAQSLKKISRGVVTAMDLPDINTTLSRSTSTTAVMVHDAFAVTSRRKVKSAEMTTSKAQFRSDGGLSSSLQVCQCPNINITARGTDTSDLRCSKLTTLSDMMKTYLNTGMLINTLVENAVNRVKPSISINTDKNISDFEYNTIDTSNSKLKTYLNTGMLINSLVENAMNRMIPSTCAERQSKSTDVYADLKSNSILSRRKADSSTQFSNFEQKETMSERIGNSHLISMRMLAHSGDEAGAQTEPVRISGEVLSPLQYKCTSVSTSQCALDQPTKPDTVAVHDIGHASNRHSSSVIGRRKSNLSKNSSFKLKTRAAVLSSNLDADKWIKACIEKGYLSQLDLGRTSMNDRKHASVSNWSSVLRCHRGWRCESKSVGSETTDEGQHLANNVTTVASAFTDVEYDKQLVPTKDTSCENQIVRMVDNVTSDEKTEVKEITLQASPQSSNAATQFSQIKEQKSVSVFTSQFILPSPLPCYGGTNSGTLTGDCVYVYGAPKCVMHSNEENVVSAYVQKNNQRKSLQFWPTTTKSPSVYKALYQTSQMEDEEASNGSIEQLSSSDIVYAELDALLSAVVQSKSMMTCPNVHSAAVVTSRFDTSPTLHEEDFTPQEVETLLNAVKRFAFKKVIPNMRSAAVITSLYQNNFLMNQTDEFTQYDNSPSPPNGTNSVTRLLREEINTQTSCQYPQAQLQDIPTHDKDYTYDFEGKYVGEQLMASCRYYSTLLTKQLDRVKENLTKHIKPYQQYEGKFDTTACTMKPSARDESGCQTFKNFHLKSTIFPALPPAISLTDICRHDKEHLHTVYFILTAMEGRLRRLKANID